MANPQTENGFTSIANEIAEKFCAYRISGEEWMVLWVVLRKTYGWNKKEDMISLSQFAVMTGLKRQTVLRAISKLSSKKILAVIKNDDSQINTYRFNKDFDQWSPLSKKIMVSSKKIMTVSKKDNQVSSKKGHTKETITKDTITKDRGAHQISDEEWLKSLKANPAYSGLDVDICYHKMLAWCSTNGKKPTRRRFVNWLNREERPLQSKSPGPIIQKKADDTWARCPHCRREVAKTSIHDGHCYHCMERGEIPKEIREFIEGD